MDNQYICKKCGQNLHNAIKIIGPDAWEYHQRIHALNELHMTINMQKEVLEHLIAGIKQLRDGGYGCRVEAQEILDIYELDRR